MDALSGRQLWLVTLPGDGVPRAAPVVGVDGRIHLIVDKGRLYAVSPEGALDWTMHFPDGAPFYSRPMLGPDGAVVAAGEGQRVFAVDGSGVLRWQQAVDGKILSQPAIDAGGALFVTTESGSLYAFEPSGALRFRFSQPSMHFRTAPALAGDGSAVYAAAEEKTLFALDAFTGAELWRKATRGNIKAPPVVDSDGSVILGTEGRELLVFSPSGEVVTSLLVEDRILQPASVGAGGRTVVRVGDKAL